VITAKNNVQHIEDVLLKVVIVTMVQEVVYNDNGAGGCV